MFVESSILLSNSSCLVSKPRLGSLDRRCSTLKYMYIQKVTTHHSKIDRGIRLRMQICYGPIPIWFMQNVKNLNALLNLLRLKNSNNTIDLSLNQHHYSPGMRSVLTRGFQKWAFKDRFQFCYHPPPPTVSLDIPKLQPYKLSVSRSGKIHR